MLSWIGPDSREGEEFKEETDNSNTIRDENVYATYQGDHLTKDYKISPAKAKDNPAFTVIDEQNMNGYAVNIEEKRPQMNGLSSGLHIPRPSIKRSTNGDHTLGENEQYFAREISGYDKNMSGETEGAFSDGVSYKLK